MPTHLLFVYIKSMEILQEKGFTLDEEGFKACMQEQKTKARNARKVTNYMGADVTVYESIDPSITSTFVGYDRLEHTSKISVLTGHVLQSSIVR